MIFTPFYNINLAPALIKLNVKGDKMIEIEKTYLVKYLPEELGKCKSKEIFDLYLPASSPHPQIRIRKNGDQYEITKKTQIDPNDASYLTEETIKLSEAEFNALKEAKGKSVRKIRYYYEYEGNMGEIDVFQDDLKGLVLAEFEFKSHDKKDVHELPEFCLADATQDDTFAGGLIAGKSYGDIENELKVYGYKKLHIKES